MRRIVAAMFLTACSGAPASQPAAHPTATPAAFASRSKDGRWLAIVQGDKVGLVDAQTGELFELRGADAAPDGRPGAPHRAAMFAGNRLLYIRHPAAGDDKLVVHDPAGVPAPVAVDEEHLVELSHDGASGP